MPYKATTNSAMAARDRQPADAPAIPKRPNQAWAGDITCIPTHEDWLYLVNAINLHSHRVFGWNMSERMTRHLVMDAMEMAIGQRRPDKQSSLIFHSNCGN